MRINLLSSFAAGILIATIVCGAVYFTGHTKAASPKAVQKTAVKVQPNEKEMKKALETSGYVVLSKAEYENVQNEATAETEQQAGSEKTVTKVIISVSQGMTSIDVGRMLVSAGLAQDAYQFSNDIEQRGLQNKLRPGTYTVDSEMSYDQVIAAIYQS